MNPFDPPIAEERPLAAPGEANEIAALLRQLQHAGLPLEKALHAIASDTPRGRISSALKALAGRLEAGQSPDLAIEALEEKLPPEIASALTNTHSLGAIPEAIDAAL